jgi:hypothetical protein
MRSYQSHDARLKMREILSAAERGEPVEIKRYETVTAVVVSPQWHELAAAALDYLDHKLVNEDVRAEWEACKTALEDTADVADADAAMAEPGEPVPLEDAAEEAAALNALDRLSRGGPWEPGERDALAKTYGDWVTSDPEGNTR